MNSTKKIFFPNLEGLRFFAFFVVFINHATGSIGYNNHVESFRWFRSHFLWNGNLGVSFFFVLSGFLITYLLLKEKEMSGRINIPHFYLRRVLRIWPLYFLVVALCLFVFPRLDHSLPEWFAVGPGIKEINPWLYVSFLGNFDYLANGIHNFMIGILWSVSIEEQFYLFWPLIIAFVPVRHLLKTFIGIILASIAFRFFYAQGNQMIIKYHSFSSVSDLSTGAVIAYLACQENVRVWFADLKRSRILFVYLLLIVLPPFRFYAWKMGNYYNHISAVIPVIFSLLFAFVIMEQNYSKNSLFKVNKLKLISSWGKFTYGMYCYHMVVFFVVLYLFYLMGIEMHGMSKYTFLFVVVVAFFSTIFVSEISYYYFESRFLRLKEKFGMIRKE